MAPATQEEREESIERTDEYDEFMTRLTEFHNKRGTNFEREPRVGSRRVDHLRLYKKIIEEGGYDHVSDTRASPLAWRRLGTELGFGDTNMATLAFTLKTVYYKNLAAYEIADYHKKDPPPKEILEDVSAKGGNLLNRSLDNFARPIARDAKWAANGEADEGDISQQDTPKEDRMDIDELGGGDRRSSRGLRQAPPQRQLFQSDVTLYRPTRQHNSQTHSPGPPVLNPYPTTNGMYGAAQTAAQALANYEPKPQIPLTLRPVTTPGNNPELFRIQQANIREAALAKMPNGSYAARNVPMLPGTGFSGPNVYIRTFMGLKSGVLEEQEYALHHLVKISHERGDKYRFDNFSGLIEALIDKILETANLFYNVNWKVSYQSDGDTPPKDVETLDGLNGTPDILQRIQLYEQVPWEDEVQPEDVRRKIKLIHEAALVLRNMSFLQENAEYLSRYPSVRDMLTIVLNLPNEPVIAELKQYCHEIAEQVTKYILPNPDDPLIITLIDATRSRDRGIIIASLRALSRVGVQLKATAPMQPLPTAAIVQVNEWLLVEDQDLRAACLDLLYRFTAMIDNLEALIEKIDVHALVRQLVRLLQFGSRTEEWQDIRPAPKTFTPRSFADHSEVPQIPSDLVEQLLGYDEPERSSQWLRTCFEEDQSGEITQIALWQAYQFPFTPFSAQRPLLPAKDFITNVSHTFAHASAQVQGGDPPRFVIKGIRPRAAPVDPRGRTYMRCHWILDDGSKCRDFAAAPKQLWEHIISTHLQVIKDSDGQYDFTPMDDKAFTCKWSGCQKFDSPTIDSATPFAIGMHVKTHLPDSSNMSYQRSKHNISADGSEPDDSGSTRSWTTHNTMTDERHDAAGLPLMVALVLRNLARNIPKTAQGENKENGGLVRSVFAPVKGQLYYVLAYNRSLGEYLSSLTRIIDAVEA